MTIHNEPCKTLQGIQVQVARMEVYQKENYKHINNINNHCALKTSEINKAFSVARTEREKMKLSQMKHTAYAAGFGAALGALLIPLISFIIKML